MTNTVTGFDGVVKNSWKHCTSYGASCSLKKISSSLASNPCLIQPYCFQSSVVQLPIWATAFSPHYSRLDTATSREPWHSFIVAAGARELLPFSDHVPLPHQTESVSGPVSYGMLLCSERFISPYLYNFHNIFPFVFIGSVFLLFEFILETDNPLLVTGDTWSLWFFCAEFLEAVMASVNVNLRSSTHQYFNIWSYCRLEYCYCTECLFTSLNTLWRSANRGPLLVAVSMGAFLTFLTSYTNINNIIIRIICCSTVLKSTFAWIQLVEQNSSGSICSWFSPSSLFLILRWVWCDFIFPGFLYGLCVMCALNIIQLFSKWNNTQRLKYSKWACPGPFCLLFEYFDLQNGAFQSAYYFIAHRGCLDHFCGAVIKNPNCFLRGNVHHLFRWLMILRTRWVCN